MYLKKTLDNNSECFYIDTTFFSTVAWVCGWWQTRVSAPKGQHVIPLLQWKEIVVAVQNVVPPLTTKPKPLTRKGAMRNEEKRYKF